MMGSKKMYEAFAKMFKQELEIICPLSSSEQDERYAILSLVNSTCDVFYALNPRFSRSKFLIACGIEEKSKRNTH